QTLRVKHDLQAYISESVEILFMGPETHRLSVDNMLNFVRSPDKVVVFECRDRSTDLADVNSRDLQIRLIDGVEAHNSLPEIGWCDPWFKNHQTSRLNMASHVSNRPSHTSLRFDVSNSAE